MKKTMAKILSLVLTMAMLLAFTPSVLAAEAATLPSANKEGRLTDGLTVKYGDGAVMTETALLADGFHYAASESAKYAVNPVADTARTILLDSVNNTVEFSWTEAKSVKRLEMWIWRIGAVKDYEIQVLSGAEWVKHSEGTLDQSQPTPADDASTSSACYIIHFEPIETTALRFVVKSFREGINDAKIAEAIPRSSDNVNLLAKNTLSSAWANANTTAGEFYTSAYAAGFRSSDSANPWGIGSVLSRGYRNDGSMTWPCFSSGSPVMVVRRDPNTGVAWYITSFQNAAQKINRVAIPVQTGSIQEVEIIYSQNPTQSLPWTSDAAPYMACPEVKEGSDWKLAKKVTGDFAAGTKAVIDIANAPMAKFWLVKVTKASEDMTMNPIEMYSLSESGKVSLFGTGASFGAGKNESILSDGQHYTFYDLPADRTPASNLDKLAKFTSVDSGIEFKLSDTVKRLDLWILSHGGIANYEIQTSDDGEVWSTHQSGTFAKYDNVIAANASRASYYPVVLETPVTSARMRFVIKSFYDNSKGAFISEAKYYNHNNINFTEQGVYGTGAGKINYSPYVTNFFMTQGIPSQTLAGFTKGELVFYPADSQGNIKGIAPDENACWYVTDFRRSKVKVNRIGFNISSGSISEFEIWACVPDGKTMSSWGGTGQLAVDPLLAGSASYWQKVGSISCYIDRTSQDVTFDLHNSIEANAWMLRPTVYSDNLYIPSIEMYSVAENELGSAFSAGKLTIDSETIQAGTKATFSVTSYNNVYPNASVFFALYSGDELSSVTIAPMAISENKEYFAYYTVPENATGALSLKAFLWDGTTLKPLLGSPITK